LAWDKNEVHPLLSRTAVYNSILNSTFLYQNLAFADGINETINGQKVYEWLSDGSREEDTFPRFRNHFHNPMYPIDSWNQAGLDVFGVSGQSSVLWAQDASSQANAWGGDWSWAATRQHYHQSLVALDHAAREQAFSDALLGLGHQIHLLQDKAVPAHVRNDAHPFSYNKKGSPHIEKWAAGNRNTIRQIAANSVEKPSVSLQQDAISNGTRLSPTALLSDADQYHGAIPSTTLSQGLAEYTNANFFSDNTIFNQDGDPNAPHAFPFPAKTSTNVQYYMDKDMLPATIIAKDGIEDTGFYIAKTGDGEQIDHFLKPTYFTYEVSPDTHAKTYFRLFYLDGVCHRDYAQKLIPRAVGYSAALIDYFFRGRLAVDAFPYFQDNSLYALNLKIQNLTETQEAMSEGVFSLVFRYTPEGGDPDGSDDIFVPAAEQYACPGLAYDDTMQLDFSPSAAIPLDRWNALTCTLAFQGTLGHETGAVVGKVFSPGSMLLNEDWDNGIDGTNNWQYGGNDDAWTTKQVVDGHLIMESTTYPNPDGNAHLNELVMIYKTTDSDGLLITPTTHVQFQFAGMDSVVTDERWANHALILHFSDGTKIEYSGDGRFCDWTSPELLVPLKVDLNTTITDNIFQRYEWSNRPIPDPLYLEYIQFMQLAFYETMNDHWFYMDVDFIRLFDVEKREG
jgi:hypothetical protein